MLKDECFGQLKLFEEDNYFSSNNKIRLIELFAGVGSQAMAIRDIGLDFEHYKISEWEINANNSYHSIHSNDSFDYSESLSDEQILESLLSLGVSNNGKTPMSKKELLRKSPNYRRDVYNKFKQTNNLGSICNFHGRDLEIHNTNEYTYILTYSFPCQALSLAGKQEGMDKGSGTSSSLLWEIERLFYECKEYNGNLPHILLMENVPQVISKKNIHNFNKWLDFLTSLGYSNHYNTLNAADYGIPQNRKRTFMISILGDYSFQFPNTIPLNKSIVDVLEENVDEKYYIRSESANKLIYSLIEREYQSDKTNKIIQVGNILPEKNFKNPQCGRIYDPAGVSPTLNTCGGGSREPKIIESQIVAMRGRNPDNPSDRTVGAPTEQRLEPNRQGICNTLTTVQKDNLVLEKESSILRMVRTEEGKSLRKQYESHELKHGFNEHRIPEPRKDGCSNTLSTVQKDNLVFEKLKIKQATKQGWIECQLPGVADFSFPNSKLRRGRVQGGGKISPTITANSSGIHYIESYYRIRKLTPKESWFLMGFTENDYLKAEKNNSSTQLLKQAGNSIVKQVLMAIFLQLGLQNKPKWNDLSQEERQNIVS